MSEEQRQYYGELYVLHLRIFFHNLIRMKEYDSEVHTTTRCFSDPLTRKFMQDTVRASYANLLVYTFDKICKGFLTKKHWWTASRIGIESGVNIDLEDPEQYQSLETYTSLKY